MAAQTTLPWSCCSMLQTLTCTLSPHGAHQLCHDFHQLPFHSALLRLTRPCHRYISTSIEVGPNGASAEESTTMTSSPSAPGAMAPCIMACVLKSHEVPQA